MFTRMSLKPHSIAWHRNPFAHEISICVSIIDFHRQQAPKAWEKKSREKRHLLTQNMKKPPMGYSWTFKVKSIYFGLMLTRKIYLF